MLQPLPRASSVGEPWFGGRPRLAVAAAAVLFAVVLALRLSSSDATEAYSLLYALPIALVATAFGLRAGTAAGALSVALTVLWAVVRDVSISPTGWIARAVPLLLLGVLVGEAADRIRRAERDRHRLAAAAVLHREAIEINDSLVQGMAAAKWSLESGNVEVALDTLDHTISHAHDVVSELIRQADMGGRTEHIRDVD